MKNKSSQPLVIVATKTPSAVSSYDLARFTSESGDEYITNAFSTDHLSPFDGSVVASASGKALKMSIEEADCVGVRCPDCMTINAMPAETASTRDSIHCVVCGSHLAMDLEEESEEEAMENDDAKRAEEQVDTKDGMDEYTLNDSVEDEGADDTDAMGGDDVSVDDAEEHEHNLREIEDEMTDDVEKVENLDEFVEDDSEEAGNGDSEEEAMEETVEEVSMDMDLTSLYSNAKEVVFADLGGGRYGAMVGDVLVATIESMDGEYLLTEGFARGIRENIASYGLPVALADAGFKSVVVPGPQTVARAFESASADANAKIEAAVEDRVSKLIRCMEISAAGGRVGMFRNSGVDTLMTSLASVLETVGVKNSRKLASRALASSISTYNKNLIAHAQTLSAKDDAVLSEFSAQIESMDTVGFEGGEEDESADDAVEARLSAPMRPASAPAPRVQASVNQAPEAVDFSGLFDS